MSKKVLALIFSVLSFSLISFSSNATALTMGNLEPEYTGNKIEINTPENEYSFDVTFLDKNQNLTYKTTIKNGETVPIVITKIDLKNSERNFIEYDFSGIAVDDELQPDETKELTLSIKTNDQNTVTSTEDFKLSIHYHKVATEEPAPEPDILVPGTSTEIPDTGANTNLEISSAKKDQTLFNVLIIGGIAIVLLVFLLSNKKIKNTYAIILVLSLCATFFTLSNFATAEKDNVYEITGKVRFTNVYTISIDPGAGKYNGVEGITTIEQRDGGVIALQDPTYDTYNFTGWAISPETTLNGNILTTDQAYTLTANWEEIYYGLTIDPGEGGEYNGVTGPTTISVRAKTSVDVLIPTKVGATFAYWTKGDEILDNNSIYVDNEATIVAHYTDNYYDITIDPGNGLYNGVAGPTTLNVKHGTEVTLEDPTYYTYRFTGWTITPNTTLENNTFTADQPYTFTANWEEIYCDLNINPNGGTYNNSTETVTTTHRAGTTINLSTPVKEGTTFAGWNKNNSVFTGDSFVIDEDTTLIANYDDIYYSFSLNPNGGTFNGSTAVYTDTIKYGTTVSLTNISLDGYELKDWSLGDGTTLPATTTSIQMYDDIELTANWWSATVYTVTLSPNGGSYNNVTNDIVTEIRSGEPFSIDYTPVRDGYLFNGWKVEDDSDLENTTFNVSRNITIHADWTYIATRNERTSKIYASLTDAEAEAEENDIITLLVDLTEKFTNTKKITLDLNEHTLSGYIINAHLANLLLLNGEVNNYDNPTNDEANPNNAAIINNGILTLGIDDYEDGENHVKSALVDSNYVRLIGKEIGLDQNGEFYYYDGLIEGDIALDGAYNDSPWYRDTFDGTTVRHFPFVDHNNIKDCQHVELENSDRAITKTIDSGEIYYYNLQDNINTSTVTGYKIYAVRNFDASYTITSPENTDVTFDIAGYDITINDTITVNGKFTIEDSHTTVETVDNAKGVDGDLLMPTVDGTSITTPHKTATTTATYAGLVSVPQTIINNGEFVIKNARITGTTGNDTISNRGTLTMENGILGTKTGYVLKPIQGAVYNLDNSSHLLSIANNKAVIYNNLSEFEWNSAGNITGQYYGVENKTDSKFILTNGTIYGRQASIYNSSATTTLNGGLVKAPYSGISYGTVIINSGSIIVNSSYSNSIYGIQSANVTMHDGTISVANANNAAYGIYSGKTIIVEDGTITATSEKSTAGGIFSDSYNSYSSSYVSGGTVTGHSNLGTGYGVYRSPGSNDSSTNTISGGIITGSSNSGASYGASGRAYTVTGGTITGGTGGLSTRQATITGGTIIGGNYGLYQPYSGYSSSSFVYTIGANDGEVSITTPEIIGGITAVHEVDVYFYDGVLRGGERAYEEGLIKRIADNTTIHSEVQNIDGTDYDTRYLEEEHFVAQIGDEKFKKLSDAITAAEPSDTIELIDDNYIFYAVNIPEEKDFTIITNNYDIVTSDQIINNGKVSVINNSETPSSKISCNGSGNYCITNNAGAEFTLKNNTITGTNGINNKGTVSLERIVINSTNTAINNSGTLTAQNNISLNGTSYPIYNNGGEATISNVIITGNQVYNNSGTLNITNGTTTRTGENIYEFIVNKGTMNLESFTATLNNTAYSSSNTYYSRVLYNNGTLTLTDSAISYFVGSQTTNFYQYAIALYNDGGMATISDSTLTTDTSNATHASRNYYGIYNPSGTVKIESGTVSVTGKTTAYGIWNDSGTVIIGIPEPDTSPDYGRDTADVSITNPEISATGTSTGIGVKNNTGKIYYYDGKITGSTAAMPEIPAGIEYLYEPKDEVDENGYHVRTLEWMRQQP